jgi:hypothetical protein
MKNKTVLPLPSLAIVGGVLVNCFHPPATLGRIARLGQTDGPASAVSQALIVDLDAIEDAYKQAVRAAETEGKQQAVAEAGGLRTDLAPLLWPGCPAWCRSHRTSAPAIASRQSEPQPVSAGAQARASAPDAAPCVDA